MLSDWSIKLASLFQPTRSKTKTNRDPLTIPHVPLHVFALSFDWFTGLSMSYVIVQNDYFGFGLTCLTCLTTPNMN